MINEEKELELLENTSEEEELKENMKNFIKNVIEPLLEQYKNLKFIE